MSVYFKFGQSGVVDPDLQLESPILFFLKLTFSWNELKAFANIEVQKTGITPADLSFVSRG